TVLSSCTSNDVEENYTDEQIEDGRYCAQINYYNPSTQTRSEYQLFVDVEDNLLVKVYWPNGGWLDESHFDPAELIDSKASFTNDKGYEYEVTIGLNDNLCEICYQEQEESRIHDSIEHSLEMRRLELELAELEAEIRIANMGDKVIYTGCKDLIIIQLPDKFAVAQKIGSPLAINVGDRLDCEIKNLGITPVGNLTNHNAGNIKVFAITSSRYEAENELNQFCDEYIKTWKFN
ncbi:MAG: hypothetical protein HYZ42_18015, partial [Bacteroidetes bacterium]|nr:hypothetical protein [Bacteroidota bacterium]